MTFVDVIRTIFPLGSAKRAQVADLRDFLEKKDLRKVTLALKRKNIHIAYRQMGLSSSVIADVRFPQIHVADQSKETTKAVAGWNETIERRIMRRQVLEFGKVAEERLPHLIAPHIEGMDLIKQAVACQLVAKERLHILLLGDPGTGKTDIARSASELHEASSFGLGSGTSGVGLTVSVKGKAVTKGLLPRSDGGICALDELNLIKQKDMGSLYNAMEKGFVTYTKDDKDLRYDAQVRVIATANPKGDRFVGRNLHILKEQIPFDMALLSRFHLVFFVRGPNVDRFVAITKRIVSEAAVTLTDADKEFLREFVGYAEDIEVEFPEELEEKVVEFAKALKENEKNFLVEISPRIVHGIVRLAKANARLSLRRRVLPHDLDIAQRIMKTALEVVA